MCSVPWALCISNSFICWIQVEVEAMVAAVVVVVVVEATAVVGVSHRAAGAEMMVAHIGTRVAAVAAEAAVAGAAGLGRLRGRRVSSRCTDSSISLSRLPGSRMISEKRNITSETVSEFTEVVARAIRRSRAM